jgi:hypothetical protein
MFILLVPAAWWWSGEGSSASTTDYVLMRIGAVTCHCGVGSAERVWSSGGGGGGAGRGVREAVATRQGSTLV